MFNSQYPYHPLKEFQNDVRHYGLRFICLVSLLFELRFAQMNQCKRHIFKDLNFSRTKAMYAMNI